MTRGGDNHATVRLLAVLVMTPEDELLEFKRRCLDKNSRVKATQLGAAREVLLALSAALTDGDDDTWGRIERACDLLRRPKVEPLQQPAHPATMPQPAMPQPAMPQPAMPQPAMPQPAMPQPAMPQPAMAQPAMPPPAMPPPMMMGAPAPEPATPPASMQDPKAEQTVGIDQTSPLAGFQLPFSGNNRAPESAPPDASPAPPAGETAYVQGTSPVAHLASALPFGGDKGAAQPSPMLTLEQYASLCASCEVDPASSLEIAQRYGIHSRDAREALDAQWRAQLNADAAKRARFEQLVTQYRDWVRNQGH